MEKEKTMEPGSIPPDSLVFQSPPEEKKEKKDPDGIPGTPEILEARIGSIEGIRNARPVESERKSLGHGPERKDFVLEKDVVQNIEDEASSEDEFSFHEEEEGEGEEEEEGLVFDDDPEEGWELDGEGDLEFLDDEPPAPEHTHRDVGELERRREEPALERTGRKSDLLRLSESQSTPLDLESLSKEEARNVSVDEAEAEASALSLPLETQVPSTVSSEDDVLWSVEFHDTVKGGDASSHSVAIAADSRLGDVIGGILDKDVEVSHPPLASDVVGMAEKRLGPRLMLQCMGLTRLAAVRFEGELRALRMAESEGHRWLFSLSEDTSSCLLIKVS